MSKSSGLKYVYKPTNDELVHDWDAAKQRAKYDAAKRHERYERDKLAGKTGFKGSSARTINPFGNFASVYYDPKKAHDYYMRHRRLSNSNSNWRDRYRQKYGREKPEIQGAAEEEAAGGSGGGGGSGSSDPNLANDLAKIRKAGAEEKERLRKDAKRKIDNLRNETNKKAEEVRNLIEENRKKTKNEQDKKREEAQADIKKEQDKSKKELEDEDRQLKNKRDVANEPLRKENAALRGRLENLSKTADPKEKARLQRLLASNNNKISKANADYTDALFRSKTKHTTSMRNSINQIRVDLKNFITTSSFEQRSKAVELRNELKDLRQKNQNEIKRIRQKLKVDLLKSTKSTQEKINQRRGKSSDMSKINQQLTIESKILDKMSGSSRGKKRTSSSNRNK